MNLNEQLREAYNAGRWQGLNEQMNIMPAGDGSSVKPMYVPPYLDPSGRGGYLQSPLLPADQVDYDNPPDTFIAPKQPLPLGYDRFKERQRRRKRYGQDYIPFPGF